MRLARALSDQPSASFTDVVEIEAKDFQKPVLAELAEARSRGRHRNLLVAATGTGKTVMAALDYRSLREAKQVDSLLFVAHRREILEQARRTFRHALSSQTFGELLFQGERPQEWRHVFASIDSLSEEIDVSRYDMIIVDEAHHAAADSWERLLARVSPKELLGLTGTPERADGLNYDAHFPRPWIGNLRVWQAIPHALVPFRYYMLDVEGVDLGTVTWRNGRYAPDELSGKLISAAEIFVRRAVKAVTEHLARPDEMKAIAFCSSVRHADAVCRQLQAQGVKAAVLTGDTERNARARAKDDLDSGRVQVLCVIDIYNEGVDIPSVNTLFFFRPTESATVFLQQLGRGLRRSRQKPELVVFDLTGRQNLKFRFDQRLRGFLGHTPRALRTFVETGFGHLPAGCHFQFDELARQEVLEQLKRAIPVDIRGLRRLLDDPQHRELSLEQFLAETEVDLGTLYAEKRSWTGLRHDVGLATLPLAEGEQRTLHAIHRLTHVGDEDRLATWERLARLERPIEERALRIMRMLFVVLYGKEIAADDSKAWTRWSAENAVRAEVAALIPVLRKENALFASPALLDPLVPLRLHARYLGPELSAAFDDRASSNAFRDYYTGVEPVVDGKFDLLLVTMEKGAATKQHLRYRDFPLHDRRFHWQSKARTRRDDPQGRRHLAPEQERCTQLLFVRERDEDRPGVTMGFRYLGPVRPDGDSGERPITIEWQLQHAMPHDLLESGRIAG